MDPVVVAVHLILPFLVNVSIWHCSAEQTKSVDNKLLRIDIGSTKQMLTTEQVAKIQWIPGDKMIANGLTKWGAQTYDLLRTVQEGRLAVYKLLKCPVHCTNVLLLYLNSEKLRTIHIMQVKADL